MKRLLFTKFEDWRYEDEIRLSVRLDTETNGMFFMGWSSDLKLAEIIVGLRSPTCRRELEQALGDYPEPVQMVRAQAAHDCFAIVPDPDPVRNHDDLRYFRFQGNIMHPCEFVRD